MGKQERHHDGRKGSWEISWINPQIFPSAAYIHTENPEHKQTIFGFSEVNECTDCAAITLANHWLSIIILDECWQVLRLIFLIPGGKSSLSHDSRRVLAFLVKISDIEKQVLIELSNLKKQKACWVCAFITGLQLKPVRLFGFFSYLCSSQVSGNVYVLCHLHCETKVHQHCFIWHQDNVAGCRKQRK